MNFMKFLLLLNLIPFVYGDGFLDFKKAALHEFDRIFPPVLEMLKIRLQQDESIILIIDDTPSGRRFSENILTTEVPNGMAIFHISINEAERNNITDLHGSRVILLARKVRKASRTTTVIMVSKNFSFLVSFGKWSLKRRLLGPSTKLLAVSKLTRTEVDQLLESSWTYSMMNTMIINIEEDGSNEKYDVYCHLPYTSRGRNVTVKLATWTSEMGLQLTSELGLFPLKFKNFYRSKVPVTALLYPPFWIEEKTGEKDTSIIYSGTDYSLLEAASHALNFTIHVLPITEWGQVTKKVELRESFVAPVMYMLMPDRLKQYDFSFVYVYGDMSFSFARPHVSPQWQSLYYPLSHSVWIFTLGSYFVMVVFLTLVGRSMFSSFFGSQLSAHRVFQELFGILLGQNLSSSLPVNLSGRTTVGSWLIFAFILGSVYRGNLVAYLTLPKYPPRPETIKELVEEADRVTMPSYGQDFKIFFSNSNSAVFRALGRLMDIVPSVTEGLNRAVYERGSFLDARRFQEYYIAKDFMRPDGITQLYIGREVLSPGQCAWPLPHDAPYTHVFSWVQMAVTEAGMYNHWNRELLLKTMIETRRNKRKQTSGTDRSQSSSNNSGIMSLTLIHLQGPLMLLLTGLLLAVISFILEIVLLPSK